MIVLTVWTDSTFKGENLITWTIRTDMIVVTISLSSYHCESCCILQKIIIPYYWFKKYIGAKLNLHYQYTFQMIVTPFYVFTNEEICVQVECRLMKITFKIWANLTSEEQQKECVDGLFNINCRASFIQLMNFNFQDCSAMTSPPLYCQFHYNYFTHWMIWGILVWLSLRRISDYRRTSSHVTVCKAGIHPSAWRTDEERERQLTWK